MSLGKDFMFSVSAVMPYNKIREEKTFIRKIIEIVLIKEEASIGK